MADLAEFLLARIAEDAAASNARGLDAMVGYRWKHLPEADYNAIQADWLATARRVLAECEAKRRIIKLHRYEGVLVAGASECRTCKFDGSDWPWPCATLRFLAAPYADHPDFDLSWRDREDT